jgi:hypothetical protein
MKLRAGLERSSAEQDRLELFRLARAKGQGHKCKRCNATETSGGWMLDKSDATRLSRQISCDTSNSTCYHEG